MRHWIAWFLVGVIILVGAFFLNDRATKPLEKADVVIRLKWLHQAQFAGFYAAQERGYFAAAKLKVQFEPGGPNFPAIQMVVSGGEQFGVTGADQILLARSQGVPVVPLMVIYRENPFVLFATKESGIDSVNKFGGRKVGVKLGGNEELIYRAMVRATGIDVTKIVEVPVSFDMTPFFAKAVEVWPGYAINEPLIAEEKGTSVTIIKPSAYGIELYADTLFTTEKYIREHPGIVKDVVFAALKGWQYVLDNPNEGALMSVKFAPESTLAHQLAMMNASIPLIKPDGRSIGLMTAAGWEKTQKILTDGGFLKSPVNVDQMLQIARIGGGVLE